MSPSEELRHKLDERGIKWQSGAFGDTRITYWESNGVEWCAIEYDDGRLVVNIGIDLTPEQAIAATVDKRSCASCPETDNPDSYISHLQSALKWHDEHVPRHVAPNGTCVVLEGEKVPEEVLFIGANGVTHYLPENTGTCVNEWAKFGKFKCSKCGLQVDSMSTNMTAPIPIRHCPNCGRKIKGDWT